MDKNKKFLIIAGILLVFLVVFLGVNEYQNKEGILKKEITTEENEEFFSLSQPNPTNPKELLDFISFCEDARFSGIDELLSKEAKQVVCQQTKMSPKFIDLYGFSDRPYLPLVFASKSVLSLESGRYIGISVDLRDVVWEYSPSLLEKDKLYFCNISEPSWTDHIVLQIEPEQNLIFAEGDVFCAGIKMDKNPSINFFGFVPQTNSLNIKSYLVDEQTVFDVMNKQSFLDIKEILKNYPIIWQMEKPIIP